MTTTTAVKSAAGKGVPLNAPEPIKLRKRIGSTTFIINVAPGPSATERAERILLRVIESDPLVAQSTRHWPGGQVGVSRIA